MVKNIFFLGDSLVGKTTIIDRYISGQFHDKQPITVNVSFYSKSLPNQSLKITDSSGQKKFRSFLLSYLHDIDVFVLVYDITKKTSFDNLDNWLSLINEQENPTIFIVGNKSDLNDRREVPTEDAQNYADVNKFHFFEVSSFDGSNIDYLFTEISQL